MIKIVSLQTCSYCDLAKNLLSDLWFEFEVLDLTNNQEKLNEIVWITGMMIVPQIFNWEISKENLIWWYMDIKALHEEWKLVDLLK